MKSIDVGSFEDDGCEFNRNLYRHAREAKKKHLVLEFSFFI